ncbi:ArsC family reductase [Noviherbaspirillum suwonense]|uniref:Arsenate reductase n=1 Tax=Noviherbaspirillum suwonense TaxID=1224511 RepID=A0ABY1PW75_9BURK|nr:ArsC family reductase [Noviherbaspirillum suwonense]SMP47391.1 arsenate reductase [Noviherbaspirillum suwonense]
MDTTLYGIPNCDTVRKARAWLADRNIAYRFHDFKKEGASRELASSWLASLPWESLVNMRGTTWRALPQAQRDAVVDADSAIALMMAAPSVIKRPVLATGGACHVGYSAQQYAQLFDAQAAA